MSASRLSGRRPTVSWKGRTLPLQNLAFRILFEGNAIGLASLQLSGEGVAIRGSGRLQDQESPQLSLSADADIQGALISQMLKREIGSEPIPVLSTP